MQAPTKYGFAVNFKAAKGLGLTVPDKLLTLADEVIGKQPMSAVVQMLWGEAARKRHPSAD